MILPPHPLAPYELMPMPSVSDAQLHAIVERHGLDGAITPMSSTGVVHSLWALGSRLALRVPKEEHMCLGDHRCEAVAIPLALSAGVRTPDIVVFDESLSVLDVPYSIVERIEGVDLAAKPAGHSAFEEVGRELAKLHAAGLPPKPNTWLRRRMPLPAPRTLIHGDVKPDNVMLDSSGQTHLIDWGDAGPGDPAYDFGSLPMRSVEVALRGYRSVRQADPTLESRIVQCIVARSLSNMRRSPPDGPSWYRPLAANLTDLLTFAIDQPERWREWTG